MHSATTFGHWLKQRRKTQGLTQKALALQAGCAEVTLRKIERGDLQPSAALVAAIAAALDVPETDLPGLVSLARGLEDDFTSRARLLRPQRPNNLPAQLTPLIGREGDITAVRKRLLADGARLVTLLGPPGVGKTRLALAVAEDVLEQFNDGVFFVRLAPVSDPGQVAAAVAQALGLQMGGPNPPELQLRAYLEEKHLLLVLDNFEQIVAAAPLVDDLLRRCPWLHVLVTSRQPLRVRGERQFHVQPLALPVAASVADHITAGDMLRYPAVVLFADRAEAVLPDFAVDDGNAAAVAELCRRLDGLPLAIELVAARVKLLPPKELLQRLHGPWLLSTDGLRDVSARQKTLRGAVGWSYDLLSPAEQTLFTYLSVFVGGFTLEAAELLCGDTLSPPLPLTFTPGQVLDGIASLLDKSLLHRETGLYGGPRYMMLETVREYNQERLVADSETDILRARHAACFLRLVEQVELSDPYPSKVLVVDLVDNEIHNLRSAFAWATEYDNQVALLLGAALMSWSGRRGPDSEGRQLIDRVFSLPGVEGHTVPRVKALLCAAAKTEDQKPEEGLSFAKEALAISRELEYSKGEAAALLWLGRITHIRLRDGQAANRFLTSSLAHYRTLEDAGGIAHALVVLSEVALLEADFSQARILAEESIADAQRAGFNYPWPLAVLANVAWSEGNLAVARKLYEQSLAIARPLRQNGTLIYVLTEAGYLATLQRDFKAAHSFLDEAFAFLEKMADAVFTCACKWYLAVLAQAEGGYGDAVRLYQTCLPGMIRYRSNMGPHLLHLAAMAEALEQHELVARLLGAVGPVSETICRLFPVEQDEYNRLASSSSSNLDALTFEAALAQGRQQEFIQTVEEALTILESVVGTMDQLASEARYA